jgi:hypothetical protein
MVATAQELPAESADKKKNGRRMMIRMLSVGATMVRSFHPC